MCVCKCLDIRDLAEVLGEVVVKVKQVGQAIDEIEEFSAGGQLFSAGSPNLKLNVIDTQRTTHTTHKTHAHLHDVVVPEVPIVRFTGLLPIWVQGILTIKLQEVFTDVRVRVLPLFLLHRPPGVALGRHAA